MTCFWLYRGTSFNVQSNNHHVMAGYQNGSWLRELISCQKAQFSNNFLLTIIHIKNPTRCHSVTRFYFIFIWSSTCFGLHADSVQQLHVQQPSTHAKPEADSAVSGSWWWAVRRLKHVRHSTVPDNVHQLHVQQPFTHAKPEAASAVLGSWWWAVCRPKHVELHINMEQ